MAGVRTVKVRFDASADGLVRESKKAGAAMQTWQGKISKFGAVATAAAATAGIALFQLAKSSVNAFVEAEEAQARLQDAFARFPALADTNINKLQAMNLALQAKTKFDDDSIGSGQAVLAQFKLTGKQIEDLTPLLLDYAAKTGKDLPTAAETLGKSFLGNVRALKELGINYKSTGDQAKDTANITELLRAQVGGFAERQGKTAAGQAAILRNQFGEIQEMIGKKLIPVLMTLATWGLKTIDWMQKNKDTLIPLGIALGVIVATITAVNVAMKAYVAIQTVVKAATLVWTGVQWLLNTALWASGIPEIVLLITALVVVIVLIATKTTWFQDIWRVTWTNVKKWALAVWDWLKGLPGMIGSAFGKIADFITAPFRAGFNAIARLWNNTVGRLSFTVPSWVPGLGGKGFSMPQLPVMHRGGIVPGPPGADVPILAQAGERVVPRNQAGPTVIETHIHIGDEVVRVVRSEIKDERRDTQRRVMAGAGSR